MNISNIALFHRVPERADDDSFDRCADLDFILNIIMTSPIRSNKDLNFQKCSFFKRFSLITIILLIIFSVQVNCIILVSCLTYIVTVCNY